MSGGSDVYTDVKVWGVGVGGLFDDHPFCNDDVTRCIDLDFE